MSATWYTETLRWIAVRMTHLADDLDTPSHGADPLAAPRDLLPPEEHVFELRNRLARYY